MTRCHGKLPSLSFSDNSTAVSFKIPARALPASMPMGISSSLFCPPQ
eukprot:Gb_31988 [translate_table: standard]